MFELQQKQHFILQVSDLTMQIKSLLESDFSYIEVEGEVSGITYHGSGHIYFSLKDENATISCTFFRGNARKSSMKLQNGDKIIVKGAINVFLPRGTYSLNVLECRYSGKGDLQAQYEKLKKELQERQFFSKNKALPKFPKKIILLTSKTSAALQDMIKVASKRFCLCEFILIDTLTQGKEAKYSIAKNLEYADGLNADILVLARGGGSIEDLWSFNEIEVLEAIFACKTPVVSAIGHEIDYLLSDYVADKRAPTPSAAMEMILCDKQGLIIQLMELENHLQHNLQSFVKFKKGVIQNITNHLEYMNPCNKTALLRQGLLLDSKNLQEGITIFLHRKKTLLEQYSKQLEIVKPMQKIQQSKLILESLSLQLTSNLNSLLKSKRDKMQYMQTQIQTMIKSMLLQKHNMLPNNLHHSLIIFIEKKKGVLNNYYEILKNINPELLMQKGFVQILKDNKPIQIKDLNLNENIELVDTSGSAKAQIKQIHLNVK